MRFLKLFLILTLIQLSLPREALAEWGLSISPPVIEIRAESPDEIKRTFEITNEAQETVDLEIKFIPVSHDGKFLNIQLPIKTWVAIEDESETVIDRLTLRPKETRSLNIHIFIPGAIEDTDYYFLIAFVSKSKPLAEGISEKQLRAFSNIRAGVSTNILLSVGQTIDASTNLEVIEFLIPRFVQEGPVQFQLKFKNEGKHFARASGTLEVSNIFGQKVANIPIPEQNILAQGSRTASLIFTENFLLGPYIAQLNINNSKTHEQVMFFALPVKKLTLAVVIILFLLLLKKRLALRLRT